MSYKEKLNKKRLLQSHKQIPLLVEDQNDSFPAFSSHLNFSPSSYSNQPISNLTRNDFADLDLVPDIEMLLFENEVLPNNRSDLSFLNLVADNYSEFAMELLSNNNLEQSSESVNDLNLLNLIDDFDCDNELELSLDRQNQHDDFLYNLVKLIIKTKTIPETFSDKLLKMLQPFIPNCPATFRTLINRFIKNHDDFDYCIRCVNTKCKELIRFNRRNTSNIKCSKCNSTVDFKDHTNKRLPQTVIFSIKEQLQKFSEITSDLEKLPSDLNNEFTIELIGSSDGLPLSKSSKIDLYPKVLFIKNFGDKKLMKKLVVYSTFTLFQGEDKCDRDLVLQPMIDEINELKDGFPTAWSNITKIKYTAFVADAVCRASIVNVQLHNGTFPCHRCKIIYRKLSDEKKIFPVLTSDEITLKTHDFHLGCLKMLNEIIGSNNEGCEHVAGIKGSTPLLQIKDFDIVNDVIFDIMHCGFLGVYRHLIDSYINNSSLDLFIHVNGKKPSKAKKIELIDQQIDKIKHPSCFSRKLRSIKEQPHFKCSEYQNILFYFSYFIFKPILKEEFFNHQMLLSSILIKLWSSNIKENELHLVKKEIDQFIIGLRDLNYGDEFLRFNHHCLVHLYEDRIKHGPLCHVNMYHLEGLLQVFKSFFLSKNMRIVTLASKAILDQIINSNDVLDAKDGQLLEKIQIQELNDEDRTFLSNFSGKSFFAELDLDGLKIRTSYSNKIEDSYVKLRDNNFYKINLIFKAEGKLKILAKRLIIQDFRLNFSNLNFNLNQIKKVIAFSNRLEVFDVESEKIKQCFFILSETEKFIVDLDF